MLLACGQNLKWNHFDILAQGRSVIHCTIKEKLLIYYSLNRRRSDWKCTVPSFSPLPKPLSVFSFVTKHDWLRKGTTELWRDCIQPSSMYPSVSAIFIMRSFSPSLLPTDFTARPRLQDWMNMDGERTLNGCKNWIERIVVALNA